MDNFNPIIKQDYPDPDIVRVGGMYYLLSTTMHFFPGGSVLSSRDLINWEIEGYVFDELDSTAQEHLEHEQNIYGHGMWAPSLRYHNGLFYALFLSIGKKSTYVFTAEKAAGPWKRHVINTEFYDASLLFDDDRVFVIHGNTEIRLTEIDIDNFTVKKNGLNLSLFKDEHNVSLGYEGTHAYKIGSTYCIFNIHWPKDDPAIRTQVVHTSENIEGPYLETELIRDDYGLSDNGVAQGGIIDTPSGKYYGFFFRDQGACGRIPILTPIEIRNGVPFVGENGKIPAFEPPVFGKRSSKTEPLYASGFLKDGKLHKAWQFNHLPKQSLYAFNGNSYSITTDKLCVNVTEAVNTLTQRSTWPKCHAEVTVDASKLNFGDHAGICAFESCYGELSITKEIGGYFLNLITRDVNDKLNGRTDCFPGNLLEQIALPSSTVRLRIDMNFQGLADTALFSYKTEKRFEKLPYSHKLAFRLDHFCGVRFGLFCYSTSVTGGTAVFSDFKYGI
ncbi:MAG: glycoside hydrolase 43 family protein [Lachnospiraceae bacterium]|nr:glycoside hydrolase 43 family protein [Lachnospiraceae bacterium]